MIRAFQVLVGLALLAPAGALAQDSRPAPADPSPAPSSEEGDEDAKKKDRWFAVHAGWVHPVVGGARRNVTILARNGAIAAIGSNLDVPADAEVLDARGFHVYPGLVAFDSGGIVGTTPEDSTDMFGLNMSMALAAGITTVGSGGSVCKLTFGTLEGHVLGRSSLARLDLSSAQGRKSLREALEAARDHVRKMRAANQARARGEKVTPPKPPKGQAGGLVSLLLGQRQAHVRAGSVRELTTVANLALQFGFSAVVEGGEEAWVVAPLLGRAGFSVVVVPRSRRRANSQSNRPSGWSIENAAKLHQAGVPIAIMSRSKGIGTGGLAGRDLFTLALEAGFAVRGGLPETAALEAITLGPARLLGVADQIGSIEVGKDCDLVIAGGDLLHYQTLPQWTIVNGRVAYDKEQDSLLRAVRSRNLNGENVELPQLWPRPSGSAPPEIPEGD